MASNRSTWTRTVPARVLLVLAFVAAGHPAAAQDAPARTIRADPLVPGVTTLAMPPDGTVLIASGSSGTLVVDAGAPALAERVDSAVQAHAASPVRWVVTTHYHEDHRGANPAFRATGVELIAHRNVPAEARRDTTIVELEWRRTAAPADALPTRTFADSIVLDLGGEQAVVFHVPGAHTSGDAMVHLRRANVVHTGDVVELGAYPFIDRWAGGSIDGLIAAVDALLERTDERTRIVPGHGTVIARDELIAYREMLVTVTARLREAVAANEPIEALLEARVTAPYDARHGGERHGQRFVQLLHAELRQEIDR